VAWLLAALVVVLLAGYAVLATATHELTFGSNFWTNVLVIVPIAAAGLLVAARQPGTRSGGSPWPRGALLARLGQRPVRGTGLPDGSSPARGPGGGAARVVLVPVGPDLPDDHPALPGRDFAVAALAAALEPAHVSVWVRPPE
jgi:hypothetical protein